MSISNTRLSALSMKDHHLEHARRFLPKAKKPKANYAEAEQKVLLIIDNKKEEATVKKRVRETADAMKAERGAPEIVGLVVSLNHDTYTMYRGEDTDPLFFVCDGVAKCLAKDSRGRFETAQVCKKPREN